MRRVLVALLAFVCVAVVIGYQVTRPERAAGKPRVFVPSSSFFEDFSPAFRTSIADAYFLYLVQYYGEHVDGDGRLDSAADLVRLVTDLSPRFLKAYQFGTFALLDAGESAAAYELLKRGAEANPDDWHVPALAGFLVYAFGRGEQKLQIAADWYRRAGAIPGAPAYLDRLAATLTAKGGEREKAALMWAQVYADGDKYSRQKAVAALDELLPADAAGRTKGVEALREAMTAQQFDALRQELGVGQ